MSVRRTNSRLAIASAIAVIGGAARVDGAAMVDVLAELLIDVTLLESD